LAPWNCFASTNFDVQTPALRSFSEFEDLYHDISPFPVKSHVNLGYFDASMLSFTGLTGSRRVSRLWSKRRKPQSTKHESSKKEASNQVSARQDLPEQLSSHQKLFEQQPAYKYNDLQDPYEIRILEVSPAVSEDDPICCSIIHVSISPNASTSYQALSYAWGSSQRQFPIFINIPNSNDQPSIFKVPRNTY
jgi:hypothetical protein